MGDRVKFSPRLTPLLDRVTSELWNLDFDLERAIELIEDTVSKGGNTRADIGLVREYVRDALGCLSGARSHLAHAQDEQAILEGKRQRPQLPGAQQPPGDDSKEGT